MITDKRRKPSAVKYVGNDPDPTDFLYVSLEQKRQDQCKPYDAKRSCWVPDEKEGFVLGEIKSAKADQVTVSIGYKEAQFRKDQVAQVNPPKFEKCEDMSDLTYLNDASVLWNLKSRYFAKLIYTYSGLFCVAVNPYQRYPIYTERVVRLYEGKRRTEVPPHIFAVSDTAYRDLLTNDQNQSILITGESGAGKTENTKKVIYYFAVVGSNVKQSPNPSDKKESNLETQIIQTNPILEAFGNAKTVRNDNSSRFGKFIRIHFNPKGKIAGADIETYLLEKARVVSQQPNERSYHIFYQIMSDGVKGLLKSLHLTKDLDDYPHQSMGCTTIEGIDDKEEMLLTDSSMDILGFSSNEKLNTYKIVATVMHLGNMKFKQRGREEQAEADGEAEGKTVCKLLGMNSDDLFENLLRPQIKVGGEYVTQGRNKRQVYYSVSALCKAIFEKLFSWLVFKCNKTMDTNIKREHFIGVLDIAGFEIFEFNSFEQICINFTNEKLQQFFNHHMFVLEQEEYQREGINWTFIDFGLDLQACIDLIEKPLGIFSILEEESMFPKATDKSFEEKLINNHMGKSTNFVRPKQTGHGKQHHPQNDNDKEKEDLNPHFAIIHYAGTVAYNVNGWLEKNKDPLNDSVVEQMKSAKNKLASELFRDIGGDPKQSKRTRGSAFQTVSALYREQVQNLMHTLQATSPHFIRCIIPNEKKDPSKMDAHLVMHQLTCNGVLEGIRICRKGFPNRMFYKDFKERYLILASKQMLAAGNDNKAAARACFHVIQLEDEKYRIGHSKVFFRSGVLGYLEELRDAKLAQMITYLQAACRGYLGKLRSSIWMKRKKALTVVQRAIRNFLKIRPWMWYRLFKTIKPMLEMGVTDDIIQELKEKLQAQRFAMDAEEKRIQEIEEELEKNEEEKRKLLEEMKKKMKQIDDIQAKEEEMRESLARKEKEIKDALSKLEAEEDAKYEAEQARKRAQMEINKLKEEMDDMKQALANSKQDKDSKSQQLCALKDELERQSDQMSKLNREKKEMHQQNLRIQEDLEASEEKNRSLDKVRRKLETELDDMENSLQREKQAKNELDKLRRKAEEELKRFMADSKDQEEARQNLMALSQRKEKEMAALMAKLEEEQAGCAKHQKMMRERAMRIDELEEELDAEQKYRSQAEKQRRDLQQEIDDMRLKFEDAGEHASAQAELNRKKDAELNRLRTDLEDAQIRQDAALSAARKKHGEAMSALQREVEAAAQNRRKMEKEKQDLSNRAKEAEIEADRARADRANLEKELKRERQAHVDYKSRYEEANRNIQELDHIKERLSGENNDLFRRLEEAENQNNHINLLRTSLQTQLDDAKRLSDQEAKERSNLMSKYRNMEREHDIMKSHLDDELQAKVDLQRQLGNLNGEIAAWKAKYENETVPILEDLEHAKSKLQLRLAEAQDTIEGLSSRCTNLEKSKQRMSAEMDDLQAQFDGVSSRKEQLEKQVMNFDRIADEWRRKIEELKRELYESQNENKIRHAELAQERSNHERLKEEHSISKLEVKRLGEEIKELLSQIGDDGRHFRELQMQLKRVNLEKDELKAALDEAESDLNAEINKVLRTEIERDKLKSEIEERLREKEEEFENSRKSLLRLIATLEASLEAEQKARAELERLKKRLEADIRELEMALDHSNHDKIQLHKSLKRSIAQVAQLNQQLEDEKNGKEEIREKLYLTERRANALENELEKCKTYLEQSERAQKQMEMELRDTRSQLHDETLKFGSLATLKRQLEAEVASLKADLTDSSHAIKDLELKCRRAMEDTMQYAEDLRDRSERLNREESLRRGLENQLKELSSHFEEMEANSLRGGRKMVEKLEAQIKALESDLDAEERLRIEAVKCRRKAERRAKDFGLRLEEKEKSYNGMHELLHPLHGRIRTLKLQVEDAEEIAALNLSKFKKAIGEAEDAEKRAYIAEMAVNKLRAKSAVPGGSYY